MKTPPPIDWLPEVGIPVPTPFVLDWVPTKRNRKKEMLK
jgi:hypothetical protein